ncbi:MAG: hypothetical protein A2156_02435 [Deltaproteobacteria bacterium RBG_16_48_10]|nr:MAG: hypothetical protein A2156_02435 [Deltaproteobacteria bacterium RBG_16_48_10]
MVKVKNVIITGLILLTGILVVFYLFPSEEKKVRKQFDLLSQYVSKKPGEDLFSMANRIKNMGKLFAEDCEFKIEGDPFYSFSGKYSREEVSGYALRGRSYFSDLSLKFHDLKIEFPEKGLAKVNLTARLAGKSTARESVDEARELQCLLKKIEKKWLFSSFEVVEVLKR